MKKYKTYQIILLVIISLLLNLCGKNLAEALNLPLWLDSFGTVLTAYVAGPLLGAIVGAAGNVIYGFVNPISFAYSITSISIALVVGYFARRGSMKNVFKTMSLSVLVTGVCVVTSRTPTPTRRRAPRRQAAWTRSTARRRPPLGNPRMSSTV